MYVVCFALFLISMKCSLYIVCATVLGLWPSPLASALDNLQGFQSQGPLGGGDLLEYFPGLTRMTESLSLINSGSSSPVDSETSGISSGSDHLVSKVKKSKWEMEQQFKQGFEGWRRSAQLVVCN